MRKVVCVNDGKEFMFKTDSSETAIRMMQRFLDIGYKYSEAAIGKNDEAYYMLHGNKAYVCLI